MYAALRPLLFALPAEASHRVALAAVRALGALPGRPDPARTGSGTPHQLMGMHIANRVGLAAGLDKNAAAVTGFARLGFGFVEVGTVTPRPQPGNPKPRLFRLAEDEAVINRMGFNSAGAAAVARHLARARRRGLSIPVGVNIGRNKDTPNERAVDDYVQGMSTFLPLADYITVNLSSPNTPGLRDLQAAREARVLLAALQAERDSFEAAGARRVPIAVKIAPDLTPEGLADIAEVIASVGLDGVIATNTTITRPRSLRSRLRDQQGGLSGRPLGPLALDAVTALRRRLPDSVAVIGVGGIHDTTSARAMLDAGADAVQIYTALVYHGPSMVAPLARALG